MQLSRPIAMSIAGLDPCGGAGMLADIKTFERHKVYGLGIATAQTLQTESDFVSIRWDDDKQIIRAVEHMLSHYDVRAAKIGIVQSVTSLYRIVSAIRAANETVKIVVDPVIRSTTDFNFWQGNMDQALLYNILGLIELITPNYKEVVRLAPGLDAKAAAQQLSRYGNVLLKGGHSEEEPGIDYLYTQQEVLLLLPHSPQVFAKHGSGCVLSSSIAAWLAMGYDLATACKKAKIYTETFLLSNPSLLGFHVS